MDGDPEPVPCGCSFVPMSVSVNELNPPTDLEISMRKGFLSVRIVQPHEPVTNCVLADMKFMGNASSGVRDQRWEG